MKVDDVKSSFQKLSAGSVVDRNQEAAEKKNIEKAAESNSEAAATITRVAQSSVDAPKRDVEEQQEVERVNRSSSGSSVDDVSKLADLLAEKIRQQPNQAIQAQANQGQAKVRELLQ